MKILINDHRKLFAIQEEFSKAFPNLGLLFYSKRSHEKAEHSRKAVLHGGATIGECRIIHEKGELTITPQMTVADLEDAFSSVYGLTVEVATKKGDKQTVVENGKGRSLEALNAKA